MTQLPLNVAAGPEPKGMLFEMQEIKTIVEAQWSEATTKTHHGGTEKSQAANYTNENRIHANWFGKSMSKSG